MVKVRVEVFGGVNPSHFDSSGCQGCGPVSTGQREYEVIREILADLFGTEVLTMEYIDTMGKDLTLFPPIDQALKQGHLFPMVTINGVMRWSGSIPLGAIIEVVQAELAG
ncbi:MAG TPA: hypothetical protein P5309_06975 [Syntrophomonadaceae bacterium]|nr:hypothetical protein [Syntrophomonadaceae bacterium]